MECKYQKGLLTDLIRLDTRRLVEFKLDKRKENSIVTKSKINSTKRIQRLKYKYNN